jgi:hypothetical protein
MQQQQQQQRWSFNRNNASGEANATTDTWDALYRHAPPIFKQIDARIGELYEAEGTVFRNRSERGDGSTVPTNITDLPNKTALRQVDRCLQETITRLMDGAIESGYAQCDDGGKTPSDAMITVKIPLAEWGELRRLMLQLKGSSSILVKNVGDTVDSIKNTQKSLKRLNTEIREFVATVWSINAERSKAFPPFFTDLGPLYPSVYGTGAVSTSTIITNSKSTTAQRSGGATSATQPDSTPPT